MEGWALHWLEAEGSLQAFRPALISEIQSAHAVLSRHMSPPRLDILIQRLKKAVIPEMGILGHAHRPTLLTLTVDPENQNFSASLQDGALQRQTVHEVHHCLRMAGPGYGFTLGEALVSEGLAGQFVRMLFGSAPELWENAVPVEMLRSMLVDTEKLRVSSYDHSTWFYGTGPHPRWLGYSLGYRMVESWLSRAGRVELSDWIAVPSATVINAALADRLLVEP